MVGPNGSVGLIGGRIEQTDDDKFTPAFDRIKNASPHMAHIADRGHDMLVDVTEIAFVNLVRKPERRENIEEGEVLVTIGLKGEDGPLAFHPNAAQFAQFAETYEEAMKNVARERTELGTFTERVTGGNGTANGRHTG